MNARLVVLASGRGTNLQAVIDACADGRIPAAVVAVGTNKADAFALERAARAGISSFTLTPAAGEQRAEYDARLADACELHAPDWIVLAGWMRILTMPFLGRFPGRVVNLHPALPGAYPGTRAIERAYADAQAMRCTSTGVMIHLVPDEGVDDGPVLAVREVPIYPEETIDELTARVHQTEHELLIETLASLTQPTKEAFRV